jgi:hypothetical protein
MTKDVQLPVQMCNVKIARLDFQTKRAGWSSARLLSIAALLTLLFGFFAPHSDAAGPRKEGVSTCSKYSIPASVLEKPFFFADELVPVQRQDVQSRVAAQINFLLLDARSVLMDWLTERRRYSWIFDETLSKEQVPKDFVWFAPVLAGLTKSPGRAAPAGWWALEKPCDPSEGVQMSEDSWHDDRLDLELSTRCFASRLKSIRKDLADEGWLMTAAAYVTSAKTIQDLRSRWQTRSYWDLPLPDTAEDLIVRWIALGIISTHKEAFGLKVKNTPPLTFDQITGLSLAKDLSVAEISRLSGVSSREIMEMNPKLKPSAGIFPATEKGKSQAHVIAVPKGKGWVVVNKLKEAGYLSSGQKP